MSLLKNLVILCVFQFISCNDQNGPIFRTNLGHIQGSIFTSDNGKEFLAFRGIPFAKPPVKELRFKDPEPFDDSWDGILDATEDPNSCIQYDMFRNTFEGEEDCLYLNVYTPKFESQDFTDPLPVMVWIHGGGFFSGTGTSSMYGPQRLMDKDGIILVAINYRVGPFGYLTTLDENFPGNYGMLDQVMALQWVRDNIQFFGGDANRVTIFGESAGGASVGLHLLSPLSKGLFHAAISQSGSPLSDWATPFEPNTVLDATKDLAKRVKCPTDCIKKMMKCMTKKPSMEIVMMSAQTMHDSMKAHGDSISFKPVVDKIRGDNSFLPNTPYHLITNKQFNVVPVMSGITKDEGAIFIDMYAAGFGGTQNFGKKELPYAIKSLAPSLFKNEEHGTKVSTLIIDSYFENVDETDANQKVQAISDFLSDSFFAYQVDAFNAFLAKYNVPTYVYKLTYKGERSVLPLPIPTMVPHADDLQFLFRCGYFQGTDLSDEDKKMADVMLSLWTNFAKTRVPSLKGSFAEQIPFEWKPITANNYQYLDLDLTPNMVNDHLCSKYSSWNSGYSGYKRDEL